MEPTLFAQQLVAWYRAHQRDLPWRHTRDPYLIWLSEIILQQTRVNQGLPYYLRFAEAYPTVLHFAQAPEQDILRIWQGLGYYSRARNMHHTAKHIAEQLGGQFPDSYHKLLKLKGIGPYTAAAIASLAYNEAVAVVDGNVYRVLARLYGMDDDIASPQGQKRFAELAQWLIPKNNPALPPSVYNQAIMEFGAVHCKTVAPLCVSCPFQGHCVAFAQKKQDVLPVKVKKIKTKVRNFHYLVIGYGDEVLVKRRGAGDIWQGLYDFPIVEEGQENKPLQAIYTALASRQLLHFQVGSTLTGLPLQVLGESDRYKHVLTHQHIFAKFYRLECTDKKFAEDLAERVGGVFCKWIDCEQLPKPVLVVNYLREVLRLRP